MGTHPSPVDILSRRLAWAIVASITGLAALVAVRLACIDGLVRRVSIDGPSMAPAFSGDSYEVTCGDCSFGFRCDAEHVPEDRRVLCPNCGYVVQLEENARRLPADTVLIDRWPLLWRSLRRGEVVACTAPSGDTTVKRVVALPEQSLAIKQGDLYDGPLLVRKSPVEARRVRLLVHDNAFQPRTQLPPRWHGRNRESAWRTAGGGLEFKPTAASGDRFDWLEYEHWPGTFDERSRTAPSPITDNDTYNQGETRRALNAVSDVMVSGRLQCDPGGKIALAVVDGTQRFELEITPGKRVSLRNGDRELLTRSLSTNFKQGQRIEFGAVDQQVFFSLSGRIIICHPYDRPKEAPPAAVLRPLAIGATSAALRVDQLRVWRDVYYLDPQGLARPWKMGALLADSTYALLGDNQPISIDSRHWEPPGVSRRDIRGLVYRPFWARPRP
jgi:hypothetical protein